MKNIIFTTGGTGGHIYPALAIAKELRKQGYNIIFVGTKYRMEKDLVPNQGFEFIGLDLIPIKSISGMYKLIKSTILARKILKTKKIDAIISFGNYISLPCSIMAVFLKKPLYLQEQNIDFGMANKFLKRYAKKIFLAFNETAIKYKLYKKNIYVLGNPLREEFYINDIKEQKAILITGGSLGAKNINDTFLEYIEDFLNKDVKIYWSTGKNNYDEIIKKIDNKYQKNENIVIKPYFDNMCEIMKKSKLIICRAGALTISELIQLKKPSILIPYDYVGQNENADMLVKNNASFKYSNKELKKAFLKALYLIDNENELENMKKNIEKLNLGNSTKNIVNEIVGDLNGNKE